MGSARGFLGGCLLAVIASASVYAQHYPAKPIRMIVASSPGTSSDLFARTLAQGLTDRYKMQVVVDNRVGAGGLIGNALVSQAASDGYTLGMVGLTRIVSALLRKDAPYDPIKDTAPIMQVASVPNVVVVTPSLHVSTLREFVALARSRPGELNFASVGVGSSSHLAGEIFARAAGIKAVHVPFKVLADSYTEAIAGQIHFFVYTLPSTLAVVRDGKLRPLAVTSTHRSPALPSVPTVAEAGVPGAHFDNWSAIVAPGGAPKKIVQRLHADITAILNDPATRQKFTRQGAEPTADSTPDRLAALMRAEDERYLKLVADGVISPQ